MQAPCCRDPPPTCSFTFSSDAPNLTCVSSAHAQPSLALTGQIGRHLDRVGHASLLAKGCSRFRHDGSYTSPGSKKASPRQRRCSQSPWPVSHAGASWLVSLQFTAIAIHQLFGERERQSLTPGAMTLLSISSANESLSAMGWA